MDWSRGCCRRRSAAPRNPARIYAVDALSSEEEANSILFGSAVKQPLLEESLASSDASFRGTSCPVWLKVGDNVLKPTAHVLPGVGALALRKGHRWLTGRPVLSSGGCTHSLEWRLQLAYLRLCLAMGGAHERLESPAMGELRECIMLADVAAQIETACKLDRERVSCGCLDGTTLSRTLAAAAASNSPTWKLQQHVLSEVRLAGAMCYKCFHHTDEIRCEALAVSNFEKEAARAAVQCIEESVSLGPRNKILFRNYSEISQMVVYWAPGSSMQGCSALPAGVQFDTVERAQVENEYEAEDRTELTIIAGSVVMVTDRSDADWWKGYNESEPSTMGRFPASSVKLISAVMPKSMKRLQMLRTQTETQVRAHPSQRFIVTTAKGALVADFLLLMLTPVVEFCALHEDPDKAREFHMEWLLDNHGGFDPSKHKKANVFNPVKHNQRGARSSPDWAGDVDLDLALEGGGFAEEDDIDLLA